PDRQRRRNRHWYFRQPTTDNRQRRRSRLTDNGGAAASRLRSEALHDRVLRFDAVRGERGAYARKKSVEADRHLQRRFQAAPIARDQRLDFSALVHDGAVPRERIEIAGVEDV